MNSIRRDLLKWQIGALLITGLLTSLITYSLAWKAFNHLRDDELAQIAYSIVRHGLLTSDGEEEESDDTDKGQFVSQIWDSDNELIYSSLENAGPPPQKPGHNTLTWRGEEWHTYTLEDGGLTIQVGNPTTHHYALFRNIAPWLLLPLSLMIAVLGGLIWLAVGHALRPLQRVRAEILQQNIPSLHALDIQDLPEEVAPIGEALNNLLLRLEHAFATERDFIANAAHELRTPLTAVRLQAQLVSQEKKSGESQAALSQLLAGVDRASHLIEQLLQMARLEPDAQQFIFSEVRFDYLVKSTIACFASQADAKAIDLGIGKCQPAWVLGHAESLRVLLSNLVDNALRYTPPGGRIDVDIEEADGQAILTVSDTGPGIPEASRERVFDRFYRLADGKVPGSGLGLAISKQVVQLHAGGITLEDVPTGGLRVRILIPSLMEKSTGRTTMRNSKADRSDAKDRETPAE